MIDYKLKWNPFDVQAKWTGKWWYLCGFVYVCICECIEHAIVVMVYENKWISECDGHLTDVQPELVFGGSFGQFGDDITSRYQVSLISENSFSNQILMSCIALRVYCIKASN